MPAELLLSKSFASLITLPAISLRGLGAGQPGTTAVTRKWIALRPDIRTQPPPYPPPSLEEGRVGAYAGSIIRCPVVQAVGQRISVQNSLEYRHLRRPLPSVVPLSILSGG